MCLTIPENDLPRLAKSWLTISWNNETSITLIWCHQQVNSINLKRGFDETSNLKPSSGVERFLAGIDGNF
jgi:hypothetical protein